MKTVRTTAGTVDAQARDTANWYACNDLQPPGPPSFHIIGEVEVPNPGIDVHLSEHVPQGINPTILLLELALVQKPGLWPQMVVHKHVRFEKTNIAYKEVEILSHSTLIAKVPVEDVF